MRTRFLNIYRLVGPLRLAIILGALLLGAAASAQTGSPVGSTWDCILSGKRSGIAYVTFSADNNGTLSGYEVLVPQPLVSPHAVLVNDSLSSNGLGVRPPAPTDTTNIYGAFPISGPWGFDSKGRIVGHFIEIVHGPNCTTTVVPLGTNTFESPMPITGVSGTNLFSQTFCVTQPILTNTLISYSNQTTCYLAPVPLSTNTFPSSTPYWVTNALPSGTFCVTAPIYTNLNLITFTEGMTHYMDRVPISTNTFVSATAITQTNFLPDGTWCETVAQQPNTFADTYTLQTTCWTNPVVLATTTNTTVDWFAENVTLPDGTVRVTIPIDTNKIPLFTEQEIYYTTGFDPTQSTPVLTNTFVSYTPINFVTNLPDGELVLVLPVSAIWVPISYTNQTTLYAPSTPASVNTFPSATYYAEEHDNPDGVVCVTVPIHTNLTLLSFAEQTTCYTNHVLLEERNFVSPTAITQTNLLPDGSYWVTVPLHTNAFSGAFTEQMTCYLDPVALSSSITAGPAPIFQTTTFTGGVYCVTLPVFTNAAPGTYVNQQVCYEVQADCPGTFTNIVNFTGKVVPGKRLTLTGKTSLGTVTMRGVPAVPLGNIGGQWQGVKRQQGTSFFEFFSLASAFGSASPLNIYAAQGTGPAYAYTNGVAMLSSQKKIALALDVYNINGSYQSTRAVVGSFNPKKLTGNTTGLDSPGGMTGSTNRVTFQVTKRPSLP